MGHKEGQAMEKNIWTLEDRKIFEQIFRDQLGRLIEDLPRRKFLLADRYGREIREMESFQGLDKLINTGFHG